MLNDIAKYAEILKLFIEHFKAYNECIEAKYQPKGKPKKQRSPIFNNDPRTMRDLDAPLHYAVRQLNEDFIEWLLDQPRMDVNLRNKQRLTPLAILCGMYDWYMETMPKLKTRIETIEKERKKADKRQQKRLDDEKIELSAQKEELAMNAPTILKLIKRLLEKGADFNIYMNVGALPFDFLRKYYETETDVTDLIDHDLIDAKNVAMTKILPIPSEGKDQSEAKDQSEGVDKSKGKEESETKDQLEGKNKLKKRVVIFYKDTEDKDVTVELLEIFICFNDLEKFKHYWENFEVTRDNVKKVITLLLHVAVERNYTTYVKLIIEKASDEIFKVEQNKAKDTQVTRSVPPGRRHTKVTRSVPPGRRHTLWCCFTDPCLSMSAEDFSGWCCFGKCCRNRHSTDLQTQEELIELGETYAITSERTPMNAEATDSQTQSGTFTPEGTVPQTQSETVESQHNIPASQENIPDSQDNRAFTSETNTVPVEIHQPDSQTQSQTNGLQDNIPGSQDNAVVMSETTPITDEIHNPDSQTPNETSELLASGPQENYPGRTEGTSPSVTSSSRWWCLKCCQQEQNPSFHEETDTHEQRPNSKPKDGRMVHRTELKGLLKKVCLNGNKALLSIVLEKMNDRLLVNENPLLINTLNGAYTMKQKKESTYLLECVKLLINNHSKVDMYLEDMNGNTALHLALSYGYEKLALLMLKHGNGLIGLRNNQNFTPIDYGRRQFWDNFLDNCVTAKDRTELKLNVNFLQPLAKKEPTESKPKVSCYGSLLSCFKFFKPMKELNNSKYHFARTVTDMTALRLISLSKDRKEFLMHPVIVAFVIMKWKRLCHWNILNFLFTTITMFTFAGYTLLSPGTLKDVTMGVWKRT
ncbi:AGAP001011-PA-like protein [Anopheles sinensis]|uniref:AGAP001011-PA-like protein n=1 Tax=Anopheles sinensis TaxID=74873 RepID=A0A084VMK9_ANOSI|nr:AGAP001011-PA-like protein [Anopheles sinensis]